MNKETIEEGNKLIAGFMGAEFNKDYPTILYPGEHFEVRNVEDLKYHSSWDWLMPVVEKIEKLYDGLAFDVVIKNRWCTIEMATQFGMAYSEIEFMEIRQREESKIMAVYKSIIQFIQWYNNQNKKP